MLINKQLNVMATNGKHKEIHNGIKSWLFVEEKRGLRSESNVHFLVMCQSFITKASK
jgi:hypothetical protein